MTALAVITDIPFAPARASTTAARIDWLFLVELAISCFFVFGIFTTVLFFCLRYRRRSSDEIPPRLHGHTGLEVAWSIIPLGIMTAYFFWGADIYVKAKKPLTNAMEIHVLGKRWMWKTEHANGTREINALHVPVGVPVKLIMSSQDVIHDFFIPAFRVKQDVVPGSFTTEWFQATQTGEFYIFCAQYCGTNHAKMVGTVTVMEPQQFQAWLADTMQSPPPAVVGEKLFTSLGCAACHGQRAPTMAGLYMSEVTLQDGRKVTADDDYLRRHITNPRAEQMAGYPEIMPAFASLTEEQLFQLVSFIKSLQTVRNVGAASTQPLEAPSTRPSVGDQPRQQINFPPAEHYPPDNGFRRTQ